MSAALIDLVSVGVQDAYITGEPQVSFFRQNFKRHTNFAIKPERMDYIGTFGSNNEVTIPIRSKGDLLSYLWIEAQSISNVQTNNDGLFSNTASEPTEFSLHIGGQEVARLDSLYIQGVHNVLYRENGARASCAVTTNEVPGNARGTAVEPSADYYMIPFFFAEDFTKCLPLCGLAYHEVEVRVKCRDGFTPAETPKVYGMYVYLDSDERKYFTDQEQEILITQTQYQITSNTATEVDLTYFNHPTKAVHLVSGQSAGAAWQTEYSFDDSTLYINGTPLFENTSKTFHHNVVHEMHTSSIPSSVLDTAPLYTWPFGLTLNKSQPSGTLNFSRIDNAKLAIRNPVGGGSPQIRCYAVNYNILRIKDGLGGVAFGS